MLSATTDLCQIDAHEPPIKETHSDDSGVPVITQTVSYLDNIAEVTVDRWKWSEDPWSEWGIHLTSVPDVFTPEETLVIAAALRNAALRARQLNEADS
jgi:hypothetical protein